MSGHSLKLFDDAEALARDVAARWLAVLARRDTSRPFTVALGGGRFPKLLYQEFSRQSADALNGVHFFWGDERCVPPDDTESNYRLAAEHLFAPLGVAADKIHRVLGECEEAFAMAQAESEICRVADLIDDGQPVLDLVLLGMGEDGHVASLFPGDAEGLESSAVYRAVTGPKPPPRRITLGYPTLTAAREVWVLVSGEGKSGALRASLVDDGATPLARVLQSRTHTEIFIDFILD